MKKYLLMMLTAGAVAVIPLIYISEATAAPTATTSVEDTVTKLTAAGSTSLSIEQVQRPWLNAR
jgi:hypothetical protein